MTLIPIKCLMIILITVVLDFIKVPDRRKEITKKVALISRKVSSRKPAKEVLNWYKDIIEEFKSGKKDSYLTTEEQEIVRDFIEASDLNMPEYTFKNTASELSFMVKKLSQMSLSLGKYIVMTLAISILAYTEVICDPSIVGVKKGIYQLLIFPLVVGGVSCLIKHFKTARQ